MTTLLIYKVKYGQLSPRPHCSLLSLPQLEPELKSIPLTPIDIQDLELATGYEVSGHCRMEKEEELWGEWSPILSFQTLPSGRDLLAYPSAFVLSPGSLSSHAPSYLCRPPHPSQLQKMYGYQGISVAHKMDRNPCFCGR